MNQALRKIATIFFSLTICAACVPYSFGQQSPAARRQLRVIKYNGDMAMMLSHAAEAYETTIGLEVDPQQPRSMLFLDLLDATLTDVLNAMVQYVPRYRWREDQGFIEFSPLEGNSPLLDVVINRFNVVDVNDREAIAQLLKLPEMEASTKAMNLNRQDRAASATEDRSGKFSVSLENVTLRQALNHIAKKSGKRFWMFRRDRNGSFSIATSP
jgi:hypothetical protein